MARNEFGVESSDSGGFGAGAGDDFEDMFRSAINASVVDDEVSETKSSKRNKKRQPSFEDLNNEPEESNDNSSYTNENTSDNNEEESTFGATDDVDDMFKQAEEASVADDEISEVNSQTEDSHSDGDDSYKPESTDYGNDDSFENFGSSEADASDQWDRGTSAVTSTTTVEIEQEYKQEQEEVKEPVVYEPEPVTIAEPVPSVRPQKQEEKTVPAISRESMEEEVDYIEKVILTSDAIRDLPEDDAKAVNMFITAGQPVDSHQELVLTALQSNRQIYKTADAILEAKGKTSVDRAFYILGLDNETFADFGKILSHDLESKESVLFEGDRLIYARKLVDIVEELPAVSVKRFEAVKSVLGAGELEN